MPNDDGATQRGVEKSYTKSGGIVTDTITSLQWQDNVSSQRANWSDAVAYCSNLTIEGTAGWRLPSMHELTTLVDLGYEPKIDPLFSTKRSGKFWSSTEYAFDTSKYAYYSDFSTGFSADYGDRSVFEKSNSYAVRCVKGDAIKEGEFKRDTAKELVSDSTANLMWEDTSHINRTSDVEAAIDYCEGLNLGGFSDWKLPNLNEFNTITDRSHYDSAINLIFANRLSIGEDNNNDHYRAANYWTSTYYGPRSDDSTVHYYRTLNARDGASHRCRSYMGMHTRCVRKIK